MSGAGPDFGRATLVDVRALLAVLGLSLASCPAPEAPVDARLFIDTIFEASVECFPSFLAEAEPVFLEAQARAQIEAAIVTFERQRADPDVEFSRAAYDLCLEVARARDCDQIGADSGPCASVFRGLLADGDVCAENVQCGTQLSCVQEAGACGVCRPLAIAGEDCSAANCASGLFCDESGEPACRTQPEARTFNLDEPCTAQLGCGGLLVGLACQVVEGTTAGTCQPITIVDVDEPCEVGIGADRYCRNSSTTSLCVAGVCSRRPGLGDPCNDSGACDSTESACVEGACVDGGAPGDPCSNGFGCQLESTCQQQVCTALADNPSPPECP